jgi:hypothetical protein
MEKNNTVVAVFEQHNQADEAVRKLADSGFPMKMLSVIGKGYHTEEKAVGFYNMGERVTFWGKRGAIWGGLWGWLLGGIFMVLPFGPVVVIGYFATVVLAAIEGAVVVGGLSALAAAFYSIGIPKDSVVDYENALKADEFVVLAQGTAAETERAREILHAGGAKRIDVHSYEGKNMDMPKLKAAS